MKAYLRAYPMSLHTLRCVAVTDTEHIFDLSFYLPHSKCTTEETEACMELATRILISRGYEVETE